MADDSDCMVASMVCDGCGEVCSWNPWGRCSWGCYDEDRKDPAEHAAMLEAAPEALAFFWGLGPGEEVGRALG